MRLLSKMRRGAIVAGATVPMLALGLLAGPAQASVTPQEITPQDVILCTYEANQDGRNVRSAPGFSNPILYVLNKGDRVTVRSPVERKKADGYTWMNLRLNNPYDQWTVTSNLTLVTCRKY
jgi:hypothetical protein